MSDGGWQNPPSEDPYVRMIVDRFNVGQSYRSVLRGVMDSIKGKARGFLRAPKDQRRYLLREVKKQHDHNREVYGYVMSGGKRA